MKKFNYPEMKVKISKGETQSTISTNFGIGSADFSNLTLEREKKERKKLNDRINKAKKNNELNLLVRYTCYLYYTGYLLMRPSVFDVEHYLSNIKKHLEVKK